VELRAKGTYRAPEFDLIEGMTTLDISVKISDERKTQMLEDFPELFDALSAEEEEVELTRIATALAEGVERLRLDTEIAAAIKEKAELAHFKERNGLEIETKEDHLKLQGKEDIFEVESKEDKPKAKRK
jgi:hypothetical protein